MQLRFLIRFESAEERATFRQALLSYPILDRHADVFSPAQLTGVQKQITALSLLPGDGFSFAALTALIDFFTALDQAIGRELLVQADPEWITESAKLTAEGHVAIVADPVGAMEMLHDIRATQRREVMAALELLQTARGQLAIMHAQADHLHHHPQGGLTAEIVTS